MVIEKKEEESIIGLQTRDVISVEHAAGLLRIIISGVTLKDLGWDGIPKIKIRHIILFQIFEHTNNGQVKMRSQEKTRDKDKRETRRSKELELTEKSEEEMRFDSVIDKGIHRTDPFVITSSVVINFAT